MSIQELFQPNSYDIFVDSVTANTFNGIVVPTPIITSAPFFTIGPSGYLITDGNLDVTGQTNLNGKLKLSNTGIIPFVNGLLGYFANNPYDDVLSALNLTQLQLFPPVGYGENLPPNLIPNGGSWFTIGISLTSQRSTYLPSGSFRTIGFIIQNIQDIQPATIGGAFNVLSITAEADFGAVVLPTELVGIRVIRNGSIVVCQNIVPGDNTSNPYKLYTSHTAFKSPLNSTFFVQIYNATGAAVNATNVKLTIMNFGNTA